MMKKEDLDLAVLCTPSGLHAQETEIVASHGVVIIEKPIPPVGTMVYVWSRLAMMQAWSFL